MNCPKCNSDNTIKNGTIHTGTQKYQCNDCNRQFVENPTNRIIPPETWDLVDKLLLERIPIAGISRVTNISEPWFWTLDKGLALVQLNRIFQPERGYSSVYLEC